MHRRGSSSTLADRGLVPSVLGGVVPCPVASVRVLIQGSLHPESASRWPRTTTHSTGFRRATGLVIVGGLTGAVVILFASGQILDRIEPAAAVHSLDAYRWAFCAIAAITAFGIFRVATWLLRTR